MNLPSIMDRLARIDQEIAEERAIADALATYASEHERRVFSLKTERTALRKEVAL